MKKKRFMYLLSVFLAITICNTVVLAETEQFNPDSAAFDASSDTGYQMPGTNNIIKGQDIQFTSANEFTSSSDFQVNGQIFKAGEKVKIGSNNEISANSITDSSGVVHSYVKNLKVNTDGSYNFEESVVGNTYSKDVKGSKTSSNGKRTVESASETETQSIAKDKQVNIETKNSQNDKFDSKGNLLKSEKGNTLSGKYDGTPLFTAINYEGFEVKEDGFHLSSADSFEYDSSTSTFAKNLFIPFDGTFRVDYADQVIADSKVFNSVMDSYFKIEKSKLIKAHVISAKDNNIFKLPPDIRFIGDSIVLIADKNRGFDYELAKEIYNGVLRDGFKIRLDKNSTINFMKKSVPFLQFQSYNNGGTITVVENPTAYIKLKQGILAYMNTQYNETVETYGESVLEMDIDLGLGYIILSPISSPGGKYTYNDIRLPEASFAIYNPSNEPYELGFKKSDEFFSPAKFNSIKEGTGYGYIDFVDNNIKLSGEIQYDRYGIETFAERLLNSILRPMFISLSKFNMAQMKLGINKIDIKDFNLSNSNPENKVNAIIKQGNSVIYEKFDDRFVSINTANSTLNVIKTYNSWMPEIKWNSRGTFKQGNVIIYETESEEQQEFEKSILMSKSFNDFRRGRHYELPEWE